MTKSFHTKIIFHHPLSNQEQFALWTNALRSIDKIAVSGATQFENSLEWCIDYSDCDLTEFEAKKSFSNFLEMQSDIIKDFSFYASEPIPQVA